jgi:hypothetical protein
MMTKEYWSYSVGESVPSGTIDNILNRLSKTPDIGKRNAVFQLNVDLLRPQLTILKLTFGATCENTADSLA